MQKGGKPDNEPDNVKTHERRTDERRTGTHDGGQAGRQENGKARRHEGRRAGRREGVSAFSRFSVSRKMISSGVVSASSVSKGTTR